jgi:hypothetical protein
MRLLFESFCSCFGTYTHVVVAECGYLPSCVKPYRLSEVTVRCDRVSSFTVAALSTPKAHFTVNVSIASKSSVTSTTEWIKGIF